VRLGANAGLSHPGRKRRHNEDSYVLDPPLFVIADGMGGAKAGEVASGLAVSAAEDQATDGETGEERVVALIEEANRRVYRRASEDREASGMGTTMTVALVEGDRVFFGHVGDSRAYLIRDGHLDQLTDDHSLVAELVRGGKLTPEEAETHPQRSVITRALGTEPDIDVDTFTVHAEPRDVFMLCSDGLTTMVDDETILGAVAEHRPDLKEAAKALINAANRGGGEDNITVIFFEVDGDGDEPADTAETATREQVVAAEEPPDGPSAPPAVQTMVVPPGEVEELAEPVQRRGRLVPFLTALAILLIIAAAVLWLVNNL
jgi:protein phosphatase